MKGLLAELDEKEVKDKKNILFTNFAFKNFNKTLIKSYLASDNCSIPMESDHSDLVKIERANGMNFVYCYGGFIQL